MAVSKIEVEAVELLQLLDAPPRRLLERCLAVKSVQYDAFQQVAQGQIVKFGQCLEHLEESLLDAHSGLHSLHDELLMVFLCSHCGTNVPQYISDEQLVESTFNAGELRDVEDAGVAVTSNDCGGAEVSRLQAPLFLTPAARARSIVRECNWEGTIRNHRERFRNCCYLTLTLVGALLLASLVVKPPVGARAAVAQASAQKTPEAKFQLTSSSFEADSALPAKYACDGTGVSPALAWNDPPAGTQSFALVVDDPDVPAKTVIHWLLYDLPPATRALPEGVPTKAKLPDGSRQGKNSAGKIGYNGPCPSPGTAHHYFFKLYALEYMTGLKPKAKDADVERAIKGHILAQAELIARFQH
jgi:Raf kinase inhibitor-like YbhB/YbcL family protein